MKYKSFEEMPVWEASIRAAKVIYDITGCRKWNNEFSLKDQIRRAVCSISSNIAEGFEYDNNGDFIRFLRIAKGSLGEVKSQLYLAESLGLLEKDDFNKGYDTMGTLGKQLGGFIKYMKQYTPKQI